MVINVHPNHGAVGSHDVLAATDRGAPPYDPAGPGSLLPDVLALGNCWRAQNEVNGYKRRMGQTVINGIVRASKHIVSRIAPRQHPRHPLTPL